jgi:hypothetical protein
VVLNTAETPVLMHRLPTGAPAGVDLPGLLALEGEPIKLRTGTGGRVTAVLPARSGQVWRLPAAGRMQAAGAAAVAATPSTGMGSALSVASARVTDQGNRLQAQGHAPAGAELQLLLNGDLARATAVRADAQGRWLAEVDIGHLAAGSTGPPQSRAPHQLVAWLPAQQLASAARPFSVQRQWTLLADVADPALDDHGPEGRYVYPTDATWGNRHPMDLRRARVWRSGGALRIALTMAEVTQLWSPQNGFDHVAFTLHFSQPGRRDGVAELPLLHARLPGGGVWQHRLRAHGWSNALFSAEGAGAGTEGTPLTPGASIEVDRARAEVRFTLPAGALGAGADLAGLQLHISTWDYDGGYRALAAQPGGHTLGGGAPDAPKLMDQLLLTLP